MFGFGRLGHIAFDLVIISALLAGVKKSTGYTLKMTLFTDSALRSFMDSYLAMGETIFGMFSGYAVNSRYFKREIE
ncbi:hypothetical protein L202_03719 [Cryptococcus amylolentus CBS 6039]|uniref:DUF1748-domain-containing protein n=2 Tax=Cryptococcus TaxID=5206 RepID=A0A1E3HUK8_9TREE|nr:hypothetical protein L202_03719 [Cryptococcus amylolentus CBS 6039]XP_019035699.1 hypothetical protein L198_00577 [Cryptococcus wingfieldii CBS 7118]ODN79825.1 hypothetical protein L202_03719 [Cryptococcus amylolentus CBS 6039]ODO08844.1 hypothetical protein L198_00577 [Cryptococcus wingfieldii CBS 7118]